MRCAQAKHPKGQGIDALRAYALRAARAGGGAACPDMLLMLGDQVYADEPSPALKQALAERERPADAPADELADFVDYALAYREAWCEPAIRWLLSTVPTTMVFDDHEIHAEWRISQGWLDEMNAEPWFDRHIRAGLTAYWVFQHIGNLSPAELAAGGLYDEVRAADDAAELLAAHMDTEGRQTGHSRWSYVRELGDALLVVIDSRAGRQVTPGRRAADPGRGMGVGRRAGATAGAASAAGQLRAVPAGPRSAPRRGVRRGACRGGVGTRRRGPRRAPAAACGGGSLGLVPAQLPALRRADRRRRPWACGRRAGLDRPAVRRRPSLLPRRGRVPPRVRRGDARGDHGQTPVWQAVCSGFRKELAPTERSAIAAGTSRLAPRSHAHSRAPPASADRFGWRIVNRPAYANQIGTITATSDQATVAIETTAGADWRSPGLRTAIERRLA